MTEERLKAAIANLSDTLTALQASDMDATEVRGAFTRAVQSAVGEFSPPRRLPLYQKAAALLDRAGLGLR